MLYNLKSGFNIYNVYILYTYDISQSVGSIYTMLGYIIYLKVWVQYIYIYICNAWIYCMGYDMMWYCGWVVVAKTMAMVALGKG